MELDSRIASLLARWKSAEPKPTPAELCADCPELTPQVAQMITALSRVHAETNLPVFKHTSAPSEELGARERAGGDVDSACAVATPTHIGQYRIVATLGSGGMGVVYKAEQRHPVKRLVAVKLIKLGMDTRHVIARFESERQALAMMDHPNVAKVLDAGATDSGRPYFVMEYVPGEPITDYCDKNRLTTEDRLKLFMQICDAVQHAHQKGIIHRDLKPGNVLVEYRDGRAVPKVIDFGIAKATSSALTGITLYTEHGQMIGTPEYVSPEQAETSGMDVDTRTDIYSLGVVLYELLTGALPFDPTELRTMSYAQMQQTIRDADPPKPSTKLTKLTGEQLTNVAKRRRAEPRTLARQIRGELDWIILKAMEKDRSRRYETAAALSMDIARHLRDEPVSAGPPTATYRVGKFVRRHIIGLSAGAAIAAALLIGLGTAVYGFYSARQQRDQAIVARAQAERESKRSQEINDYLLKSLAAVDPEQAKVMDVSPDAVLKRSRELFGDNKALIGSVLSARASALRSANQLDEAERAYNEALYAYREAFGPEHSTVAATLASIGQIYYDRADYPAAERFFRDALQIKQKAFGPRSKAVADALASVTNAVAARSSPSNEEKLALKQLYREQVEATQIAYGDDDRKTATAYCGAGLWLYRNQFFAEAQPMLERGVELGRKSLKNNELLMVSMDALTKVYINQKNVAAAKQQALELNSSVQLMLGAGNPLTLQSAVGVATWLTQIKDTKAAEDVLRAAVAAASSTGNRGDPMLTEAKQSLIRIMLGQRNPDRKFLKDFWLEYIEDRRAQYGPKSAKLVPVFADAAMHFLEWGFTLEAEDLYRQAMPLQRSADPVDQSALAEVLIGYGSALTLNGRAAQAEPVLREGLQLRQESERPGHWLIAQAQCALGECLVAQGRLSDAAPMLEEACDVIYASRQAPPDVKRHALEALSKLYSMQGKPEQAAQLQQKITATSKPAVEDDLVR
jgi:serine/threonine protein kinase